MKAEVTHFLTSPAVCQHAITKEDKTLIKNLYTLECYNAKRVS